MTNRDTAKTAQALSLQDGQMAVEMACLIPVVVVMALVGFNLLRYVEACAVFDRVCKLAIVTQGVSPPGEQTQASATAAVEDSVCSSLGREESCTVEVSAEQLGMAGVTSGLSPLLVRYTCTLAYKPWPSAFSMAGVSLQAPLVLRHECQLVVDRYRPGVVV